MSVSDFTSSCKGFAGPEYHAIACLFITLHSSSNNTYRRSIDHMAVNANTKASLEITKGATALDPIPLDVSESSSVHDENERLLGPFPTEEEWATLPRVAGRIPWTAWTVASVEFVERFSYYGTSAVFVNFIQKKLPPGSKTGAGFLKKPGSGALNMGQRASTGMTTCEFS